MLDTMQPFSFLLVSAFGALVLGLISGAFGVWCGSRYGETEKRYIIQFLPVAVFSGLLLYVDLRHHIFWSFGIFNVISLLTAGAGRKRNKRARKES
jgi:hypothetical protein